jgi:translation initiation factor 2B subunit (eIF-2B alpha/beta/delta family)
VENLNTKTDGKEIIKELINSVNETRKDLRRDIRELKVELDAKVNVIQRTNVAFETTMTFQSQILNQYETKLVSVESVLNVVKVELKRIDLVEKDIEYITKSLIGVARDFSEMRGEMKQGMENILKKFYEINEKAIKTTFITKMIERGMLVAFTSAITYYVGTLIKIGG